MRNLIRQTGLNFGLFTGFRKYFIINAEEVQNIAAFRTQSSVELSCENNFF